MAQITCKATSIEGLFLIQPPILKDSRGTFTKVFETEFFKSHGFETHFIESYYTFSHKGVVRGMHFQKPPFEHTKVVYVSTGHITDVVLDLRKNSPTYGKFETFDIHGENGTIVYIPAGLAHGFESLAENSCVNYLQTSRWSQEHDSGIRFDSFGMVWDTENPVISERDTSFISFSDFSSPF